MKIPIVKLKPKFTSWKTPTQADWDNLIDSVGGPLPVKIERVPGNDTVWNDVNRYLTIEYHNEQVIFIDHNGVMYIYIWPEFGTWGKDGKKVYQSFFEIFEIGSSGSGYVLRSGDTMTGPLEGVTPLNDADLTRKDYVDILVDGKEDDLGNPIVDGQILSSDTLGNRLWIDKPDSGTDPVLTEDVTATLDVGGIKSGDTFLTGTPLTDMWKSITSPYIAPNLAGIAIEPGASVEVGSTITIDTATLTWSDDSNGDNPIDAFINGIGFDIPVTLTTSGQVVDSDGSTIVKDINTTESWSFDAKDIDGNSIPSVSDSIAWQYKRTFGASPTTVSDDTTAQTVYDIMQQTALDSDHKTTYTTTADNNDGSNFTYIIYAAVHPDIVAITQNGSLPVLDAFTRLGEFNIENNAGNISAHKVYKSNLPGAFATGTTLEIE